MYQARRGQSWLRYRQGRSRVHPTRRSRSWSGAAPVGPAGRRQAAGLGNSDSRNSRPSPNSWTSREVPRAGPGDPAAVEDQLTDHLSGGREHSTELAGRPSLSVNDAVASSIQTASIPRWVVKSEEMTTPPENSSPQTAATETVPAGIEVSDHARPRRRRRATRSSGRQVRAARWDLRGARSRLPRPHNRRRRSQGGATANRSDTLNVGAAEAGWTGPPAKAITDPTISPVLRRPSRRPHCCTVPPTEISVNRIAIRRSTPPTSASRRHQPLPSSTPPRFDSVRA